MPPRRHLHGGPFGVPATASTLSEVPLVARSRGVWCFAVRPPLRTVDPECSLPLGVISPWRTSRGGGHSFFRVRLGWGRQVVWHGRVINCRQSLARCALAPPGALPRVTAGPGDRGSGGVGTWRGSAHGTASASCPHMGGCDSAVSCRTATARLPPRAGRCRAMRARFSAGGCPAHDFRRDASRARQGWQHFAHEELRW